MVNYLTRNHIPLGEFGFKDPITGRSRKMKAKVQETIKIDDGKHEGVISRIDYRDKPYNYVDIVIKENKSDIELRCGVPFSVTENTALGKLLITFGAELKVNEELEIEDYLKAGVKVEFLTITETTSKGTFARIVTDSLRPVK